MIVALCAVLLGNSVQIKYLHKGPQHVLLVWIYTHTHMSLLIS